MSDDEIQVLDGTSVVELIQNFKRKRGESKDAITLITAGKTGVGKSTLVNNFLNLPKDKVAKARKSSDPVTKEVKVYSKEINGLLVRVVDTPGLAAEKLSGMGDTERKVIAQLSLVNEDGGADLLLYCSSLQQRFDASDKHTIQVLTRSFGEEIWDHAIFVLTNADVIVDSESSDDSDDSDDPENQKDKLRPLKELINQYVQTFDKALASVLSSKHKEKVPVKSIYSFNPKPDASLIDISKDQRKQEFEGILGLPVTKKLDTLPGWNDALVLESIRKCKATAIEGFMQLQGYKFVFKRMLSEDSKQVKNSSKVGGEAGAITGAIAGAGVGALVGGVVGGPAGVITGGFGAVVGAGVGVFVGIGGVGAATAGISGVLKFLGSEDILDQIKARKELKKMRISKKKADKEEKKGT